jgi:hypothetical protein
MAVTLNASTSSGFIQTADTSGVLTLQSNGTDALSVSSSNLQFNSGYGSVATAYGCRAWVNFNGTGTVAIRASGNVTSITDNGTGTYTVNITNAMPDANYCVTTAMSTNVSNNRDIGAVFNQLTTSFQISTWSTGGAQEDYALVCASIFR